jgi:dTDP-glucose 4,6-dehydratase
MKIVVTGGAGFIGSNFVHYMAKKYPNYEQTVVDSLTYAGSKSRIDSLKSAIRFIKADICDEAAMDKLIKGSDMVVHFAAESHVDRSIADPGPFLQTNILGTDILARLAVKHGVKRFHHVSTDEVFGSLKIGEETYFNESTPYDPRSPYSASKAASDHIVRAYGETYGLPYTITNCSNNYGPADSPGRIIPLFITNLIEGKKLPVYGQGTAVRDYLFVKDHCKAIDLAIHKGASKTTYCVGGGTQQNGYQVAKTILEVFGMDETMIEYVADRPGHDQRYAINPAKISKELDWQPSVTFKEGIVQTVTWYRQNQDWWRPVKEKLSLMRDSLIYQQAGKKI